MHVSPLFHIKTSHVLLNSDNTSRTIGIFENNIINNNIIHSNSHHPKVQN
jgi:hypothetical protein